MDVLEHEILKALYNKAGFSVTATGSDEKGMTPIYKRHYGFNQLQFGVLADIIFNPSKYDEKIHPANTIFYIQKAKATREQVNISEKDWHNLSDAIEILAYYKHIKDEGADSPYEVDDRKISLTIEGVLAYKRKEYLKKSEEDEINSLKNKITRIELNQKTNWLRNELIKFCCTATLGALIALAPKLLETKKQSQPDKLKMTTADTIVVKLNTPTFDSLNLKFK